MVLNKGNWTHLGDMMDIVYAIALRRPLVSRPLLVPSAGKDSTMSLFSVGTRGCPA